MPNFDIIRKAQPAKTFRVASVMGTYDLQENAVEEHFVGSITPPDEWQIGLIVGASGTGKTTIAKELFPDAYIERFEYTHECLLDDMPQNASMADITKALTSVGFASVPSWLKQYAVLSNGEKMRCDLARAILSDNKLFVFDEFTSVVDRNVAKIGSFAMQKAIRKTDKQFIAATCHYDVEDWLLPDWVFDTNTMTFRSNEGLKKNRPECKLDIYETKQKDYYWRVFRKYHYLSHSHNNAARVFVATLNGDLCAFLSILYFCHPKVKNAWRVHRLVTLPDYQGLGIGSRVLDWVAKQNAQQGKKTIITTSNPAIIGNLCKNELWRITRRSRLITGSGSGIIQNKYIKGSTSCARITITAEYSNNK
ncbi:MAG: GNAT family N-acetyltransferase [Caryophanon sp.]|nr:GNAT family N-acetyltransferase [Caryophanon sp.]